MFKGIIPRTRVNYSLLDLLVASVFFMLSSRNNREQTVSIIKNLTHQDNILLMPSGRAGLYYILRSLNIETVIVPSYTCNAVIEAIGLAGKKILHIDIEADGYNIDVKSFEEKAVPNSIFIATHQYGVPCKINPLKEICKSRNIFIIEDMAPAFGGRTAGAPLGSFGDAAFYSFDTTKLITVPSKSGFIFVRDTNLFRKIKDDYGTNIKQMPAMLSLKNLLKGFVFIFIENKYIYSLFYFFYFFVQKRVTLETNAVLQEKGAFYTFDVADWQCSLAKKQLLQSQYIIDKRQRMYDWMHTELKDCKSFSVNSEDTNTDWACIRFPIAVKGDKMRFYRKLVKNGVDCAFSFTHIICPIGHKNAVNMAESILDLPFYYKLSDKEIKYIIKTLKNIDGEESMPYESNKDD